MCRRNMCFFLFFFCFMKKETTMSSWQRGQQSPSLSIQHYKRHCVCLFVSLQKKKKKSVRCNFIGFVFRGFKDGDNVYTRQRDGKMWRWNEGIYSSLDLLSSMTYIYPPPVATPPPPPYWPFSFLYL